MKILILGVSGLIGHNILKEFDENFEVFGTLHKSKKKYGNLNLFSSQNIIENVDVKDFEILKSILFAINPDVILNCVGITKRKIDKTNPIEVIMVNSVFPHQLAEWAKSQHKRVIHFSTDCVFDGKVGNYSETSLTTAEDLYGKKMGGLEMGVLYTQIPDSIKKAVINPYISIENNEARINLRILDSQENLRRNDLIKKITLDLENQLGLKPSEFKLAGVLILFNNLLQSLFKSQILTLGVVMAGITVMFLILFRNITLSFIGVVPNFIAAFLILGIIGLLGIPLDMMTITIAAITIGIAVDNSIHYIYRFKEEFKNIKNYNKTLEKCHATVGVAILNTSITIIFGFSILVLSNFIPTIYFGVFTGIAMLLAMISVLTLLPKLILIVKPFGNE